MKSASKFPCTLHREDALVGADLTDRLKLDDVDGSSSMTGAAHNERLLVEAPTTTIWEEVSRVHIEHEAAAEDGVNEFHPLSLFETIFTTYPPILESLLSQLPTRSVFDLFHTNRYLRSFLYQYPLAWKTLSFRLPQPALMLTSPGVETPDGRDRQSRQQFLNGLLAHVILPIATRLTSLDLCNTAVDGIALCANVWNPRKTTLKHLSVRGCKNVSIKYHIVPFLQHNSPQYSPWIKKKDLALTSLYTYRCRHHRRRPYLPSSLIRRDSDSEPTHELIEICHMMSIWTDTAWCPTPGARCYRRKDYHGNRAAPGTAEVWVPFDRLWRSQNRIGPVEGGPKHEPNDGRLWETSDAGHDGEPLYGVSRRFEGEGKDMPAHLRQSHKVFVENIKCDQCADIIVERCETCSVRMHCMGCRKTLCASCAFNRPLARKRPKIRNFEALLMGEDAASSSSSLPSASTTQGSSTRNREHRKRNRFWWAPGAYRSPNLMSETSEDTDSDNSSVDIPAPNGTAIQTQLKLNMHWCCLEPIFSGGGGIAFLGPGLGGRGAEKVRAAPLPRTKKYADPDFIPSVPCPDSFRDLKEQTLYESVLGEDVDILPYLKQDNVELQALTCPRSLCQDCYRMCRWKVNCRGCRRALCKEHDFRGLKVRKCGYRDLSIEREWVRSRSPPKELKIPAFKGFAALHTKLLSSADLESSSESARADTPDWGRQLSQDSTSSALDSFDLSASVSNLDSRVTSSFTPALPKHRSHSFSGLRPRTAIASWPASVNAPAERIPLPGSARHPVQWEGCGAYFCQAFRPVGDSRPRCGAGMKVCTACGVWVCEVRCVTHPSQFTKLASLKTLNSRDANSSNAVLPPRLPQLHVCLLHQQLPVPALRRCACEPIEVQERRGEAATPCGRAGETAAV